MSSCKDRNPSSLQPTAFSLAGAARARDGLRQVEYEIAVGVALVPRAGLEEPLLDAEYRREAGRRCRRVDPDADDSAEQRVVATRCGAFERYSPVA